MKIKRHILIFIFSLTVNFILAVCTGAVEERVTAASCDSHLLKNETLLVENSVTDEIGFNQMYAKSTVRVLIPENSQVKTVPIEEYITGVLTGEMYSDAPVEALKAVAVAARTYTLYMCEENKNKLYDVIADSNKSQAYYSFEDAVSVWGEAGNEKYKTMSHAIHETEGQVITYNSSLICAFYHASSYPMTESCKNIFFEDHVYLSGVESVETAESAYKSDLAYDIDEFNRILSENGYPTVSKSGHKIINLKNDNGRCIALIISDEDKQFTVSGRDVRRVFSLNSTSFDVNVVQQTTNFNVYGFGHGVGLSQNGAAIMAKKGNTYEEILKYYYPGTELFKTVYKD